MSLLQFRPAITRFYLLAAGLFLLIHIGLAATPAGLSFGASLDQGPGGPILLLTSSSNPFSQYYAEILRTEGLNAFASVDISQVSKKLLEAYDVVILGEMRLPEDQVGFFEEYVKNGGNLIAMRPDKTNKKLLSLLGIAPTFSTMSDKYLVLSSPTGAATGLVKDPIQFHGAADTYALDGAVPLALLYSDRATATSNPAVVWRSFGSGAGRNGQTAAFTFDVARSIVYTRQGNPAWERQLRDTSPGCPLTGTQPCVSGVIAPPITSHDLFYGDVGADQPWIDFNNIAIPQADELQRFFANLILLMNQDTKPLPRFWYFPRGKKAVVIMTGDGHTGSIPQGRFDVYKRFDSEGCSVDNWECVRSTAYIFSGSSLDSEQAARYNREGFEISIHINIYNNTTCSDWPTEAVLRFFYRQQLTEWQAKYAGVPPPSTQRTHCVVWSDYTTQAQVELANGIRLDTTYYHYPYTWTLDRPGFFTGSGIPMRFASSDGSMIDVYQAATQFTDQSFQTFPKSAQQLLDRALGPEGYYGAFTANMHVDGVASNESDAIIRTALDRGVSVISARQMLTWLDGRGIIHRSAISTGPAAS